MILGITGRAGSGKTVVEEWVTQNFNMVVIDLDKVGHHVLERPDVVTGLVDLFGISILSETKVSRQELGKIVFNNPEKLDQLNAYIHPIIKHVVKDAVMNNVGADVCIFGALIQEIKLAAICDKILTIDADDSEIKKHSEKQYAISRLQRTRKSYQDEADTVIKNDFSDRFLEDLKTFFKNNFRLTSTIDKINVT